MTLDLWYDILLLFVSDVVPAVTSTLGFTHTVTERFLRYVVIDTQSDPSLPDLPIYRKAKGPGPPACRANCRRWGSATPISTNTATSMRRIPANTRQAGSGRFASARIWTPRRNAAARTSSRKSCRNYRGGDIVLPGDLTQVIRVAEHPALIDQIGNDIVTVGRHHAARRRQQGRHRRNHGCDGFLIDNPQIDTARCGSCSRPTRRSAAASTRSI